MIDSQKSILTVASQNVLLDYTRTRKGLILPQEKRIGSIAATLAHFHDRFDVVGIQEAHATGTTHNGEALSSALGFDAGFWVNHNQKPYPQSPTGRSGEYMGLFGAAVDNAEVIELGDSRRALCSIIAGVAFVTIHLRSGSNARIKRRDQARALTGALEPFDAAVILGDFNEPPIRKYSLARDEFARSGFRSVFELTGQVAPVTCPIDSYKDAASAGRGWQSAFVRRGWPIDDIQVRGSRLNVLAAGVLDRVIDDQFTDAASSVPREGSDHDGIWARIEIS